MVKLVVKRHGERKAVSPVLATLLMIAVAVAMSVIIFMWSQGFLSQTSESTGSQQGSQNQAAQSSIAIEMATFTTGTSSKITVIVRNVGAVSVTLGSITVTGISSNSNFTGSLIYTWSSTASTDITETSGTWTMGTGTDSSSEVGISKGGSKTLVLSGSLSNNDNTIIAAGDVISIKITTTAGTFAQATYTVP